jgi:hypothetical protein
MVLVRVHAARRHQADQVAGSAARLKRVDQAGQRRVAGQRAVLHRTVDARQVLHHHAAGAQVHVADLGIAHLSLGQADVAAAGLDQGVRVVAQKAVPGGRVRLRDGIVGGLLAVAPAVQDAQNDGAGTVRCLGHGGLAVRSL